MDRDQLTTGRGTARKILREIIVGVSQVTKSAAYNIKPSAEASRSPVTAIAHCFARKGFKWMQLWQNNRRQKAERQNYCQKTTKHGGVVVILSNKVMWGNYCIIILSQTPKNAICTSHDLLFSSRMFGRRVF